MRYQMNFGRLATDGKQRAGFKGAPFRIAILGDFSGRANAGQLETGAQLAKRKPIKIDVDNLDDILERFSPTLNLTVGGAGGTVSIKPRSIDDLHPDELYANVELFEELSALRMQVENNSMFDRAVEAIKGWASEGTISKVRHRRSRSRGNAVPVQGRLDDFARLMGQAVAPAEPTPADELVKQMMAPYAVAGDDPDQAMVLGAVDEALSGAMRAILHHPDFQALESAWRSLDFLVRRVETSQSLQIIVYDISAEELAADLSAHDDLTQSGLYNLLVEQPLLDEQQGAFSLFVGAYTFELTPPHAELLARVARLAAAGEAPFIASIGTDCITVKEDDLHPLVQQSWGALRGMPECAYLGLTVPRFMLRRPYGAKGEPIDAFKFEEFNDQVGLRAFLWGNSAILAAVLMAETYNRQGDRMMLGKIMSLGDMPYHFYTDSDGDQMALPSTERLLSERTSAHVTGQRFLPVLSIKGRPEVRLGSFQSVAGGELLGRWAPDAVRDAIDKAIKAKAKADAVPAETTEAAPVPVAAEPRKKRAPAPVPVAAEPRPKEKPAPAADTTDASASEAEPEEALAESLDADDAGDDSALDDLLAELDDSSEEEVAEASADGDEDDDGTDLDALLADLGGDDDDEDSDGGDDVMDDLDALLAELDDGDDESSDDDDEEMDPELAALLDSL